MSVDEKQLVAVLTSFKEDMIEAFDRRIGIVEENFQHKLDLVVEGQQMLAERMDRMEGKLDQVEKRLDRVEVKVDAVAADLTAHRADTEAHHGV
ncbi:hypothetical protein [Geobacter sp.]|uniref:hypothetical protein n=1 Tax=Geobacter sp. TaxID=46610 RepID=UPI0026021954|nr:hypothetical protein [Geobacter sp.]